MIAGKRSGRVDRERVARWNGHGYTRVQSDGFIVLYADAWEAVRRDCIVSGELAPFAAVVPLWRSRPTVIVRGQCEPNGENRT